LKKKLGQEGLGVSITEANQEPKARTQRKLRVDKGKRKKGPASGVPQARALLINPGVWSSSTSLLVPVSIGLGGIRP
jgi:hypothetical protein